jgi:hypothetical protein
LINDQGAVVVDHRPQIALDGLAVEMGSFVQAYGSAETGVTADNFTLALGSGNQTVMLQPSTSGINGTRILSKSGELLDSSAIVAPRALKVDGVLLSDPGPLNAAVVIVDTDMDGMVAASGTIGSQVTGGFILVPEAGSMPCGVSGDLMVLLGPDASVTTVSITNTTVDVSPGGLLESGQSVALSGVCGADSLTAKTVVIVDDQRI